MLAMRTFGDIKILRQRQRGIIGIELLIVDQSWWNDKIVHEYIVGRGCAVVVLSSRSGGFGEEVL